MAAKVPHQYQGVRRLMEALLVVPAPTLLLKAAFLKGSASLTKTKSVTSTVQSVLLVKHSTPGESPTVQSSACKQFEVEELGVTALGE
jgi:hypothetical protein